MSQVNPVIFSIGNFDVKWYSVLILVGALFGYYLLQKEAKRHNFPSDFIFNLFFWTMIIGFIGARLYYVVFNWSIYQSDPLSIFKIWEGGLAIHGGILFGFLTIAFYCHRYNVNTFKITDIASVSVLLAQAIGRWGNFFNGEAHGIETTLANLQNLHIPNIIIEGLHINGHYYHPTFFYESLWCLLGVILLLIVRKYRYLKIGQQTCIYFMWYSFGRFFIESIRTDSLMLGGFRVAQIVSIILFVIAMLAFMILSRKSKFEDLYSEENQQSINF